ncbi:wings apart-like protein homolog [Liolophura sinensis]|uniref:wings apart-like protein homolog n=1 Tax=Liolophura sinensis TaxID=3198878 RepID=UPI0031586F87
MGTECDRMPRHVTRTYAKVKESTSSRAFDEIFSDKINKPTAARATIHKWGKTSFTSVRGSRETAFDLKRRRVEQKRANQDPFTFELDDGPSSPRKRRTQGSGVNTVLTPAVARQVLKEYKAVSSNESPIKTETLDDDDDDDDEISLIKKPVKTYTRQPLSKPLPVAKTVDKPCENSEPDGSEGGAVKSEGKVDSQRSSQSSAITIHSSSSSQNVTEKNTDNTSDISDDDFVTFKPQALKTYSSAKQAVEPPNVKNPTVKDEEKTEFDKESSVPSWEQRNKYQAKMVYRSPSKTPQNPSRQETLTIIRVSPPSWFKKSTPDLQKPEQSDSDTDGNSKTSVSKLTYESQTFKKVQPPKDSDSFDFVSDSGNQLSALPGRSARRPKRKFFKSRKGEISSEDNESESVNSGENKNMDYVPSQAEARLVAEIFGDDQSEGPNSNKSGETGESEVNDSEPEMPKLSPAPQLSEAEPVQEMDQGTPETTMTTNGNDDNPEPPVLKTYTRKREKPARYESKEPKKIFKSKNQAKTDKRREMEENLQKKIFTSPKKSPSKALYNPRTWKVEDEEEPQKAQSKPIVVKKKPVVKSAFDDDFDDDGVVEEKPKLLRTMVWPKQAGEEGFTSLHVNREHKELFTVVKNVKQAHECQEIGETQEFMDDIEYLLVGLLDTEPTSVRCLSCLSLATKCTMASFRMHLRAHGVVAKVFSALHDAYTHASLSLCTAAMMFMLSRDRLNMDLDRPSLDLLLKLLGVEQQEDEGTTPSKLSSGAAKDLKRTKDRIQELIHNMQKEGGIKRFDLETVSTGNLAMESLLSLTSRRAGEVFKEELRILGALDHIVDTVCHCTKMMETSIEEELTDVSVEYFRKVERCLTVLEQVTYCNRDNQDHLISYKNSALISAICRALSVCEQSVSQYPVNVDTETLKIDKTSIGWAIHSCMMSVLKVLLNLTHENEFGCTMIGEQENFLNVTLLCTLKSPQFVPPDTRFDLLVLSLGTMINLVEHCDINRRRFINASTITSFEQPCPTKQVSSLEGIIGLFRLREEAARRAEVEAMSPDGKGKSVEEGEDANQSGSWQESQSGLEWVVNPNRSKPDPQKEVEELRHQKDQQKEQDDEEYFTKALHKAGRHMEDSIVAAYIALLLGCVIQDNQEFVQMVKEYFEDGEFMPMIKILKKFLGFMNLTTAITTSGGKSIARVIEILESC